MSVVAEYVESEPQKARLLELGVNYLQGTWSVNPAAGRMTGIKSRALPGSDD
jgi:EAL domain-containing protein (putative c-di-GMP-specific phosphodiesterase class I)